METTEQPTTTTSETVETPAVQRAVMSAAELAIALGNVLPFASSDPYRPILCAVLIEHATTEDGADTLRLTATDSYALARQTIAAGALSSPVDNRDALPASILVDASTLADVVKLATRAGRGSKIAPVTIESDGRDVTFSTFDQTVRARIVDAEFPKVEQIIPSPDAPIGPEPVTLNAKFLAKVCKIRDKDGKPGAALTVRPGETHLKPATVTSGAFFALLMPIRPR